MPTSCRIREAEGVVESVYAGVVSPDELERAVLAAIDLAKASGMYRFYTDVTGLTGGHSASNLFAIIGLLERLDLPRTIREAIVASRSSISAADVQFYEDACQNRGWNVRIFADPESALAWLASGT